MAKLLESPKLTAQYLAQNGGKYDFFTPTNAEGKPEGKTSICLIQSKEHAEFLLKTYPELKEIPYAKWPELYKQKAKEYEESKINELLAAFPEFAEDIKKKVFSSKAEVAEPEKPKAQAKSKGD